ncbi:MAG: tRNA 2-thiouridine(34) synthase MnmA [Candidatus Pacearchaeota archaeon]
MRSKKSVLIALSGGVDSSVSALLLKKQGYEVIGLFMRTFRDEKSPSSNPCKNPGGKTDERFARLIAKILKIKLIVIDVRDSYRKQVIEPMILDYSRGLTPNPDIECNKLIKFPILMKEAEKIKTDYVATGHYAKIKRTKKGYSLLQASDKTKDQAYFLYQLTQKELSKLIFPVGNLTKKQVRKIAEKHNFPNYNKPGTTGICYLGKIPNIKLFLQKKIKQNPGKIISPEGKFLGTHPGIAYFTIGQKVQDSLGLIISKPKEHAQERYYIADKIAKTNTIIAAPENHPSLKKNKVIIHNFHIINPETKIPKSLAARIRHLGKLHKGKLRGNIFILDKPVQALAEGQAIVLYHKNEVIGGGEIRLK